MGFAEGENVTGALVGAVVEGAGEMGFAEGDDVVGALVGAVVVGDAVGATVGVVVGLPVPW